MYFAAQPHVCLPVVQERAGLCVDREYPKIHHCVITTSKSPIAFVGLRLLKQSTTRVMHSLIR